MDTRDSNQSAEYWNAVADLQPPEVRCQAWRRYADRLNADLVRRFLPAAEPFRRALKTDLFDETLGEGLTPLLTGLAENIAGIDISLAIARGAAENADVILPVNASVTDPPFREGSFDLIVSNSTLDHFSSEEEIRESLRAIARILRPGGHLIWTMDNPVNPVVRLRNFLTCRPGIMGSLVPYRMGKTWSLRTMTRELESQGLEIRGKALVMHCPRLLVIRLLQYFEKHEHSGASEFVARNLEAIERLERLPTGRLTAHYSAVHATRRP